MSLHVVASERGKLRVFALARSADEARKLSEQPGAIAKLLGIASLDEDFAEILPVENVADIGLARYLQEGYDVPENALADDRLRLDALRDRVLIVLSMAFRDAPATLEPAPGVTLIGCYPTKETDWTPREAVASESAKPFTAPSSTVRKPQSDAAMSGRIAAVTLLVLALLTWLVVWVAR